MRFAKKQHKTILPMAEHHSAYNPNANHGELDMATVTAKLSDTGQSASVEYDFGENLDAMCETFGEDIVFSQAKGALTVALQGWIRSQLRSEKSEKEIRAAVATWVPGQRRQGKSPAEKLKDQFAKMTPEERAALLEEFKAGGPGAAPPASAKNKSKK